MVQTAVSLKTLIGEDRLLISCPAGLTLGELMDEAKVPLDLRGYILPLNHGLPVRDLDYVTRPGDRITFAVMPQGRTGALILAAVAMIAIAVIAPYLGGLAATALGLTAGTAAYTAVSSGIALAITMVGSLLISALIPPPSVANTKTDSVASPLQESPTYSVNGQSNQARKYAPIPRIYGQHKFFPNLANTPLIENEGRTSRITALYDFGYGDITVQDIMIGDTPISAISPDIRIYQNTDAPSLKLVSKSVAYDQLQYRLERDVALVVRSKDNATGATIDLSFPRGLVRYDQSGNRAVASVAFQVYYRKVGTTTWNRVSASQFRGVDVDVENVTWSSAYSIGVTEWMETTFNGGSTKWQDVEIRVGGTYIGRWVYSVGGTPLEIEIGGIRYRKGGARDTGTINTKASYAKYELQTATPVAAESTVVSAATGQAITCAVYIPFPSAGLYEIQIYRRSDISDSNTLYDEAYLTLIKSFKDGDVIRLDKPHTLLEMSVVASDKISGVVQNMSATCISRLRWHNGTSWQSPQETRNPVWIVLDILTGSANKAPLSDDQLDMTSWLALAAICDENVTTTVNGVTTTQPRYMCDVVIDFRSTLQEIVSSILSVCRAQLIITSSGKYGVLIDAAQSTPRQVFTPANSWGFAGVRSFIDKPHALRVKFINPDLDWQTAEFNVYSDGYSEANATLFEDLQTFGITSYAQAYRFGRYMLAQGIHRSEVFTIKTDVENLAVQRGELVHVAHDVPKVGGMFARVRSRTNNRIVIDQTIASSATAYTVRLGTGVIRSGSIYSMVDGSTFDLDNGAGIEAGDLIVIGETDKVVGQFLVLEISPGPDLTAEISLVPYVPAVYTADTGSIPTWDPQFGSDLLQANLATTNLVATYEIIFVERRPVGHLSLSWTTTGYGLENHKVTGKVAGLTEFTIAETLSSSTEWTFDLISRPDLAGKTITVTVTPIAISGVGGTAAKATAVLAKDTTAPKPPVYFGLNIQSESVILFWQPDDDPDIDYYELRYSPDVSTPSWASGQSLARVGWQETRVTAGARTGTYMLQATDTSGNKSDVVMQRTTVSVLPNINVIQSINDRDLVPAWPGARSGLDLTSNNLISSGNYGSVTPTGIYTVQTIVDLGDIYEARVSSLIQAFGATSANLTAYLAGQPFTDVTSGVNTWGAWVDVSVSDTQPFISTWTKLSLVTVIAAYGVAWSDWRTVNVGDFTGRLFKFRIVARSFDPNIKVVVKNGLINVDMPDRIWSSSNVDIPATGRTINFDPAFRAVPTVAVSIQNNTLGLMATISNKTASSVDIILKTSAGVATAGTVDIFAKGYGRSRPSPI